MDQDDDFSTLESFLASVPGIEAPFGHGRDADEI